MEQWQPRRFHGRVLARREASVYVIRPDHAGWNATRDRYQKKYFTPDKDGKLTERGELAFAELEVESLSPTAAVVRGQYILKRENNTDTGRFTLVFRVMAGEWKIISDHTSAADKPVPEKKE